MRLTRREFLRVGAVTAAGLAVLPLLNRAAYGNAAFGGAANETAGSLDLKFLANRDAELIAALAPAILAGALPEEPASRAVALNEVVEAFDRAVSGLSPRIQGEVQELLGLLTFAPTRYLVAGVSTPWRNASVDEVAAFLQHWRNSRFALLQQGYQALARLTVACWYGNPLSWDRIEYPGPPHAKELGLL